MPAKIDFPHNFRWLIAGVTGSGKSYFTGYICEELRRLRRRFIVLDTKSDNLRGLTAMKDVHEVKVMPSTAYNWFRVLSKDYLVIRPTERTLTDELKQQYLQLLEVIYYNDRNRVVIVEEAHHLASQWNLEPIIELFVREGRGKGLSMVFTTQRIQEFSKLVWSQCDRTYIFRWFIPQDIKYIERFIPNFQELNASLAEHDVLEYNHKNGEYRVIRAGEVKRITEHYG
ncbi:helicase HerA domain-containing protein [Archaeoglobus veneficus]|uniref:ATPase n=1 Tax=Archaeoglobus veneficus (strain DSM 11195 / SNP6) TaxID=693661 RepID=F2KR37_ARCVS|nr:DUF87 domain-containing protein [Archaeoglobus veneficus]AEA46674.1 ATPase [Archaeoglobus veneficus SNP6]